MIVFVHGLFGNSDDTWRFSPTIYWPKLLLSDPTFDDSDIYVASYPASFGDTMNIERIVDNLRNRLVADKIFSEHREVVFVCHSLGGLIVERLLVKEREFDDKVRFVYFFGTPQTGADIPYFAELFGPPTFHDLAAKEDNETLQAIGGEWRNARLAIPTFCAYETKRFRGVRIVVDHDSATRICTEPEVPIDDDHEGMVKPSGTRHDSYLALVTAVRSIPIAPEKAPQPARQPTPKSPNSQSPSSHAPIKMILSPADVLALARNIDEWARARVSEGDKYVKAGTSDSDRDERRTEYDRKTQEEFDTKFAKTFEDIIQRLNRCNTDTSLLNGPPPGNVPRADFYVMGAMKLNAAGHSIPEGQPECGTGQPSAGFGESDKDMYRLEYGATELGYYKEQLELGRGKTGGMLSARSDFSLYMRDGVLCVDAKVKSELGEMGNLLPLVEVVCNRVTPAAGWDANYNDKAVEVVDQNQIPMFQIIFETPKRIRINTTFLDENNQLVIVSERGIVRVPVGPNTPVASNVLLRKIFKYPSWKYLGEYADGK